MAPMKSAITERAPIHTPPRVAAVGMYLFNSLAIDYSLNPAMVIPYSLICLATSLDELPDISIQVLENTAQVEIIKVM
jgi:hypothetical protein